MSDGGWALLREYASALEANFDLAWLETEGVPTLVQGLEPGIFGPGFTGSTPHGVRVYVPADLLEEARERMGIEEAGP